MHERIVIIGEHGGSQPDAGRRTSGSPRAGQCAIARSACAAIVSAGLTPRFLTTSSRPLRAAPDARRRGGSGRRRRRRASRHKPHRRGCGRDRTSSRNRPGRPFITSAAMTAAAVASFTCEGGEMPTRSDRKALPLQVSRRLSSPVPMQRRRTVRSAQRRTDSGRPSRAMAFDPRDSGRADDNAGRGLDRRRDSHASRVVGVRLVRRRADERLGVRAHASAQHWRRRRQPEQQRQRAEDAGG